MSPDELLTVLEAANYLKIRPWTLRHWICNHKIDVVKYGNGAVRIRRSVLDRFVARCTIRARHTDGDGIRGSQEPGLSERAGMGFGDEPVVG